MDLLQMWWENECLLHNQLQGHCKTFQRQDANKDIQANKLAISL